MTESQSVLEFINRVRHARGRDPLSVIDLRGSQRSTTDNCVLGRALECGVAGSCTPGEWAMHFESQAAAELVAHATGQPMCENHAEVMLPSWVGDLVVSFDAGLVIADPFGLGYLWAWAIPRDAADPSAGWELVTPHGELLTEDAIDFMDGEDDLV